MEFRIADTFTDSLAKLTGQEQKAVKTTAFDLQMNPAAPSLRLHKLEKTKDPHFRSVRVNRDIRLIVHQTDTGMAVFLAQNHPDARVLLTTFSEPLANALKTKLRRLISGRPRIGERVEVYDMAGIGRRLYELNIGKPDIASRNQIVRLLEQAAAQVKDHRFGMPFIIAEWDQVVDAWQLKSWEAYRDVVRLGRKTRVPEKQRIILWDIFEKVHAELEKQDLMTESDMFNRLADAVAENRGSPFDYIVVDEAQDVGVAQLRCLSALESSKPDGLFFAGDLGQRIFQHPFSWKALGIDIRGRSRTLRINYRTTHQIRMQADRLLDPKLSDVDGNTEKRSGTISIFNGPRPVIRVCDTPETEIEIVSRRILELIKKGIRPREIGVFVRSTEQIDRARKAVELAGQSLVILDETTTAGADDIAVGTMHLAKGLEFRAVVVMACDDDVIPSQKRIETVADDSELEDVYNTERHLLYVACTRARDHLMVTGVDPASEFLDDLRM